MCVCVCFGSEGAWGVGAVGMGVTGVDVGVWWVGWCWWCGGEVSRSMWSVWQPACERVV